MKCLFVGDVFPTDLNAHLFRARNVDALFTDTRSLFVGNDLNMVNLECAITDSDTPIEKIGPALKAPRETAEVLKVLGVHVCGLANNHFFDYGKKGAADTLFALRDNAILTTGYGENAEDAKKHLVLDRTSVV